MNRFPALQEPSGAGSSGARQQFVSSSQAQRNAYSCSGDWTGARLH